MHLYLQYFNTICITYAQKIPKQCRGCLEKSRLGLMGELFWQRDSLITHKLLELCLFSIENNMLFRYLAQFTFFRDTFYIFWDFLCIGYVHILYHITAKISMYIRSFGFFLVLLSFNYEVQEEKWMNGYSKVLWKVPWASNEILRWSNILCIKYKKQNKH